jgi:hypothetical protein
MQPKTLDVQVKYNWQTLLIVGVTSESKHLLRVSFLLV